MQHTALFHRFTSALSWNAFLYIAHRILSTVFVFVLYRAVPTATFSTWATVLSVIFLLLLWLDFGFRKSIARYAPVFTAHRAFALFTRTVLIFQLGVLFLAAPLFFYFLPSLFALIVRHEVPLSTSLRLIATGLFITEGLVEILRLLYHAHFMNKPFNILATTARILESAASISLIFFWPGSPSGILVTILTFKLLSSLLIIVVSLFMLPTLYKQARHDIQGVLDPEPDHNLKPLWWGFVRHSFMMWLSNGIKSLSERNFILPVLTYTLGLEQASVFKLAQDSALFFERSIIKTLGTADTALLAHVEEEAHGKVEGVLAFKKLTRQVAGLCIPLFGVLLFIWLSSETFFKDQGVFQIFLILTGTYLLEVLVSPYERILEVRQRYILLGIAYVPYMIGLYLVLRGYTFIGLVSFVLVLQGVRLVSSGIMVGFVSYYYRLRFPILFTAGWLAVAVGVAVGVWALVHRALNVFH
jgi:hypothetical protein